MRLQTRLVKLNSYKPKNRIKRLSQNELRWPLSFHIRLKSFGFFSKKGIYKFLSTDFMVSNRF